MIATRDMAQIAKSIVEKVSGGRAGGRFGGRGGSSGS